MKNSINRMPEDTHGREVVSASLERGCLRAFLFKEGIMEQNTFTLIDDALSILTNELQPHINKIYITKELLLVSGDEFINGCTDSELFLSGLYNVMADATEAYKRVYDRIELLSEKEKRVGL
jgi:hypothetical protein